jgi:hypothetical protein
VSRRGCAHAGLLLALALAACGGEAGSPGDPPAPIEGEDQIKQAWCDTLVRCELYPDLASCLAAIDVVGPEMRAAYDSGHASFDAAGASECEAALADLACEELTGAPDLAACDDVWDGTVGDGDACASTAECAAGWCDPGECDPALSCCAGVCTADDPDAGVPIDGDCSIDLCVTDAYCDETAEPPTCRALVELDGACGEGQCVEGLYCRITDPDLGTGVCSQLPGEGEPCDPDYPVCARADNWCDPADNTCHKLAAVGETCDPAADNCAPYAWCSPDGICEARPGDGEPCEDWPPCLGDLECVDDTCVMPPLETDDCE